MHCLTAGSARPARRHRVLWPRALALALLAALVCAGCYPVAAPPAGPNAATSGPRLVIYAPGTPSSVPVLMAARRMGNADVTIFSNQAQANTLFLRGDVPIFVTGLQVGTEFFKNGVPVQAVNSYVSGLTYLVTYGKPVKSLADLRGQQIYIPFRGSPIEETTQFFAEREGLVWGRDLLPVYAPFASSVELLKQGKAAAVALPEPFVTLVEKQAPVYASLSYRVHWDDLTGSTRGYPQVVTFVKRDWAAGHPELIARFNEELARAVESVAANPAAAVDETYAALGLPKEVLASALARTDLAYRGPEAAEQDIRGYYETIGKPLDETYGPFFYRSPQ